MILGGMPSPRVTVIIATYNWSTVLPFAIDSVLGQTLDDLELLVVGDGCTDDSEQVVTAMKDLALRIGFVLSKTKPSPPPRLLDCTTASPECHVLVAVDRGEAVQSMG